MIEEEPRPGSGRAQIEARLHELHASSFSWAVHCCGGDRLEAEELLQNVYLKVLEGKARYDGTGNFKTWLFSVIRISALDTKRRLWRTLRMLGQVLAHQSPAVVAPNVDQELQSAETRSRLAEMLEHLSTRQREVLRLVFYHDLSIEQAAEVMRISLGSARAHYERGKSNLRRQVEKSEVAYGNGKRRKANQRAF